MIFLLLALSVSASAQAKDDAQMKEFQKWVQTQDAEELARKQREKADFDRWVQSEKDREAQEATRRKAISDSMRSEAMSGASQSSKSSSPQAISDATKTNMKKTVSPRPVVKKRVSSDELCKQVKKRFSRLKESDLVGSDGEDVQGSRNIAFRDYLKSHLVKYSDAVSCIQLAHTVLPGHKPCVVSETADEQLQANMPAVATAATDTAQVLEQINLPEQAVAAPSPSPSPSLDDTSAVASASADAGPSETTPVPAASAPQSVVTSAPTLTTNQQKMKKILDGEQKGLESDQAALGELKDFIGAGPTSCFMGYFCSYDQAQLKKLSSKISYGASLHLQRQGLDLSNPDALKTQASSIEKYNSAVQSTLNKNQSLQASNSAFSSSLTSWNGDFRTQELPSYVEFSQSTTSSAPVSGSSSVSVPPVKAPPVNENYRNCMDAMRGDADYCRRYK